MNGDYYKISRNIRNNRIMRHMTQDELAAKSGLSTAYIYRVESGKERIGMRAFLRIKSALQVNAEALFDDADKFGTLPFYL